MYIMCRFEGRATSLDDIRRVMESQAVKPSGAGVRTLPEGFVVRWAPLPVLAPLQLYDLCFVRAPRRREAYAGADFDRNIAKFVRRGHIQTDDSWLRTWKKAVLHAHTKRK